MAGKWPQFPIPAILFQIDALEHPVFVFGAKVIMTITLVLARDKLIQVKTDADQVGLHIVFHLLPVFVIYYAEIIILDAIMNTDVGLELGLSFISFVWLGIGIAPAFCVAGMD